MLAINSSVAKSTRKTPFEVVFGQHPRSEDDIWKNIFDHQRQDDNNKIILEEDLPDDIANILQEVHHVESQSDLNQDSNNNQLETNENMVLGVVQELDNDNDNIPHEIVIDHEEFVDETELVQYYANLNISTYHNDRHRQFREEAEQSYLKNAQSQLIMYKTRSAKRQRTYVIGDIVGLKVSEVDRTNTSSTILPCKIIDKYSQNGEFMYTVATQNGIIKEHFDSMAFLDLTTANFASLRAININGLPTITFIQASQIYTNF
ncbi:unnamed protein product, partial [Rotaria sordida]